MGLCFIYLSSCFLEIIYIMKNECQKINCNLIKTKSSNWLTLILANSSLNSILLLLLLDYKKIKLTKLNIKINNFTQCH